MSYGRGAKTAVIPAAPPYNKVVTTLAGSGAAPAAFTPGYNDGAGATALFAMPTGICVLSDGKYAVADGNNNAIRIVTSAGVVSTLAKGSPFQTPWSVIQLSDGNLAVADYWESSIFIVTYPGGTVTRLAGQYDPVLYDGTFADGTGTAARFAHPQSIVQVDSSTLLVADTYNYAIRKVTYPGGVVTTVVGPGYSNTFLSRIFNISKHSIAGHYLIADTSASVLWDFTYPGLTYTKLVPSLGVYTDPADIKVLNDGNYVVCSWQKNVILLITTTGVISVLAGSGTSPGIFSGAFADGTGTGASFANPWGLAVTPSGAVLVADQCNNRIRLIT